MPAETHPDAKTLLRVLEDERRALVDGDFAALQGLAERKERALRRADRIADPAVLSRLREALDRNGALLEAAGHGIRRVADRLAQRKAQPGTLSTYGPEGDRQVHDGGARTLERRA